MKLLLLVVVAAAAACAAARPAPPSPPRKTNLGLRMLPATLPNGLRVVLVSDPNASEVEVTVRYQVGAVDDPAGQEGIAHLVEHLMFQPVIGASSVWTKLHNATTYANGTTSFDATTYTARANPARLAELLSIEAVRLGFRCASISDSVYERERQVVINELRLRDASTELLLALNRALYPEGHPYRRLGSAETVGAITRAQACAFAETHYAPANAVLVISGPVTTDHVNALLDRSVVKVARRDVAARPVVPPAPATFRRVDATAPIDDNAILVAWPLPQDLVARQTVATAASRVESLIEARGFSTWRLRFGDTAAPMLGMFILLGEDEERTTDKLLSEIEAAVGEVPASFRSTRRTWYAKAAMDRLKQSAIYRAFAALEEGSGRDEMIAATVLAGRDPNEMLAAQGLALGQLSAGVLERIAKAHLRYDQATVAVLTPSEAKKHGTPVKLATPVHDTGRVAIRRIPRRRGAPPKRTSRPSVRSPACASARSQTASTSCSCRSRACRPSRSVSSSDRAAPTSPRTSAAPRVPRRGRSTGIRSTSRI